MGGRCPRGRVADPPSEGGQKPSLRGSGNPSQGVRKTPPGGGFSGPPGTGFGTPPIWGFSGFSTPPGGFLDPPGSGNPPGRGSETPLRRGSGTPLRGVETGGRKEGVGRFSKSGTAQSGKVGSISGQKCQRVLFFRAIFATRGSKSTEEYKCGSSLHHGDIYDRQRSLI